MGTWEIDLNTGLVESSKPMLDLWDVDPEVFDGNRSLLQVKVHPDDLEPMRNAIDEAIQNRTIYELEYRIHPTPEVTRWVYSRGRCTYEAGTDRPKKFSGVVFDITERKLAEEERERAIQAQDMMISISAHELLTPVSGLKIQAQLLKRKLELGQDISRETLIHIASRTDVNLNQLSKLVSDMLDVSRIAIGKLTVETKPLNLSLLVEDVIGRNQPLTSSAGCEVQKEIEPEIMACLDGYRIGQVLTNLISNACRYAYGKPIQVRLEVVSGERVRLIVADQGIGIAKANHQRIFGRYERATTLNEKTGLGLGLFIARQIVEAHRGSITLESDPGEGAKFTVELPLAQVR